MAHADAHDGSARTAKFDVDLAAHGYGGDGDPPSVYVEVSADSNNGLLAIIAAGEHGRWSFNLAIKGRSVEITRAYEEGMRIDHAELPAWMAVVRKEIEKRLIA